MNALALIPGILFPGYLRLGPFHLPIFGLFAAAGLVCALWLSQRSARRAGLPPAQLWDAGLFAILAAFVASRALLIATDPQAFLRYPMLILMLPSLTYGGIAITIVLTFLWLRLKHLSAPAAADAWAPCGAILWAFLSLGHFIEGTDAGMPTTLPWGVRTPGDHVLGPVHPVQMYVVVFAILLCFFLMWRMRCTHRAGQVAAYGLFCGGAGSFLLDMVRQPIDIEAGLPLDPSQFVALACMLAGVGLSFAIDLAPKLSREEVAKYLEQFIRSEGTLSPRYLREPVFTDPLLMETQARFLELPRDYPPSDKEAWCSHAGLQVLSWYITMLGSATEPQRRKAS